MVSKEPAKGMKDILPAEMRLRNEVLDTMREVYRSFGFEQIETPCMERIDNLSCNQGGDNEKLVFKILKRGEKLKSASGGGDASDLVDLGMRYDLTVPLPRFHAKNAQLLPSPFKAMQIGPVWRADKPQDGRFRQFYQTDIDVIGDPSVNAEIELLCATSSFLRKVGLGSSMIRINDRRLLVALARACGFEEQSFAEVFVSMDKLDKIGLDGVCEELVHCGHGEKSVAAYREALSSFSKADDKLACCRALLAEAGAEDVLSDLEDVIAGVELFSEGETVPRLDLSLVRGMGYYTGTIFEVESAEFEGMSIAGGGRYDKMVGRFSGRDVAACGFSVGFERIVKILLEKACAEPSEDAIAVLYDKSLSPLEVSRLQAEWQKARDEGKTVSVQKKARNFNHQQEQLAERGFGRIVVVNKGDLEEG